MMPQNALFHLTSTVQWSKNKMNRSSWISQYLPILLILPGLLYRGCRTFPSRGYVTMIGDGPKNAPGGSNEDRDVHRIWAEFIRPNLGSHVGGADSLRRCSQHEIAMNFRRVRLRCLAICGANVPGGITLALGDKWVVGLQRSFHAIAEVHVEVIINVGRRNGACEAREQTVGRTIFPAGGGKWRN